MYIYQIACLFCIHFMLYKVYNSCLQQAFFDCLNNLVFEHSLKNLPKASLFIFVFLSKVETYKKNKDDMDYLDWLIELLRVIRRLQNKSIQILHQVLLRILKTYEVLDT